MASLFKKISNFFASYKLSCVLFLLLLLLTYLGTLYQVENGLYQSQKKYFESLFLIHWAYGQVPVPLPGGYLVMLLAFVNLFWGVVVRFQLTWAKAGIVTAHAGILILLGGAFVSYVYSVNGRMILYEGETSHEIDNPYNWEIGVSEASTGGPVTEYIIRQEEFEDLAGGKSRVFTFSELPVDLEIRNYSPNADLRGEGLGVSGGELTALPLAKENEENLAGARVDLIDKASGERQAALLWAGNMNPANVEMGGKRFTLALRHQRVVLSFDLRLDKFTRNLHPGTNMPQEFVSEVTKIEDGLSQQFKISMNEPFRHLGYTFYQSSWGPQNAGSGQRLYSVLSVVRNPADQVPLIACIITTIGLLLHFARKLTLYLRKAKAQTVCVDG